jgi:simple sugar transport system substrate-binding protein
MNQWISRNLSRRLFALAGLAAAAALVGCGKKEEAPKAAAPASAPAAPPALKAAWVYIGPVGDAGWTFAHDQGRKTVEKEFGDKV